MGDTGSRPLDRTEKDAARQIGGYGNISNTLKGKPGTVGHLPTSPGGYSLSGDGLGGGLGVVRDVLHQITGLTVESLA